MRKMLCGLPIIIMLATCQRHDDGSLREIRNFDAEEVFNYSHHNFDSFDAHRIHLTTEGLYIASRLNQKIRLIDIQTGEIIREFGTGKGRGPGEHENLMEFDVSDEYVTTIDITLMRITSFDKYSSEVVYTSPMKRTTTWMAHLGNFHLSSAIVSDSLFYLTDVKSDSIISSSSILDLDTAKEYGLSLSGRFIVYNDRFLYFPRKDRRVFEVMYDSTHLSRGRIFDNGIDTFTFKPSIDMSSSERVMMQAPNSRYSRSGVSKSDNNIYQLVHHFGFHPTQRYQTYLDVYDLNLKYKYSYGDLFEQFYPNGSQAISAYRDLICFRSNDNVLCYTMKDY